MFFIKKSLRNTRYFWGAFFITLCVILLGCGLLTVDYNTRWIGFGDDSPMVGLIVTADGGNALEIKVMGTEETLDFTGFQKQIKNLVESGEDFLEEMVDFLTGS